MGIVPNVTFSQWPRQGRWLGLRTTVCFCYDSGSEIGGIVVRHDTQEPGECIIKLDDGRYVRAVECMHTLPS